MIEIIPYCLIRNKSKEYAQILSKNGYRLSENYKFLYVKRIGETTYCASMKFSRRPETLKDYRVRIYIRDSTLPDWEKNRLAREEFKKLEAEGINVYLWMLDNDGFCRYCKKDFQDSGFFCSRICEEKARLAELPTCIACKKPIEYKNLIEHHIKYRPIEITENVHRSCHNKIHRSDQFPELKKYKDEEKEEHYSKKPRIKKERKIFRTEKEEKRIRMAKLLK
jgi:hypothetical protein